MEKRAVVTKYNTPDLKKETNILKKSAESFNDFIDNMLKDPTVRSLEASKEDEKTFEEENKNDRVIFLSRCSRLVHWKR
jgi:hypothetical protein